ncbi:Hsp70 family protein [Leadbettera azotonutricia]|uniref:Protein DnaK n=1 Tax=Leadbettera azotonutricia (strain ATCC BAA-888 / DSM 13862 / ZAS-9) TaxID=545695 RepID=F5Y7K1_LEAAZ|nr:Hsp70 family protein [Leadbettera azotonutricia]AEF80728.1 protein DnaK [Leadbettera azotonutricia ZAS-9]
MVVGIDLGTTFSAVALIDSNTGLPKIIPNREGSNTTPSIIQFTDEGLVFGSEAKDAFDAGVADCAASFKRNMGLDKTYCTIGGKDYTAEDLSAILLRHLKEDAEFVMKEPIEEAVITVPAYFYSKEREATMKAARLAGLKVRKIINEPTAAAIAYGLNHWRTNAKILVFDLGGGTCDVTLVAMERENDLSTIATSGDHILGGRDWDAMLGKLMAEKVLDETGIDPREDQETLTLVTRLAESCKKQLSQKASVKIPVSIPGFGQCTIEIKREEFENLTVALLNRTGTLCTTVLKDAGVRWPDITDILLVGGLTRMPQVSNYLLGLSGKKPISHVNPDEAVALGAAVQTVLKEPVYTTLAAIPSGANSRAKKPSGINTAIGQEKRISNITLLKVSDVTTHAMGIIAINQEGTEYINETIIPANNSIPVKSARAFKFYTSSREENELEIYVLQGDKKPLDCVIPYKFVVSGIRHVNGGQTILRVQYSYDQNGVIHVQARQDKDTVDLPIHKEPVPDDMSKYGRPLDPEEFKAKEETFVMLAVDVSGSMSGAPLKDAQDAMCSFVSQMDMSATQVGVVAVSDNSEVVQHLTSDAKKCSAAIRHISCGQTGYGNSAHPFTEIRNELSGRRGRRFAIILADGVWDAQDKAITAAKKCHSENIEVAAIGFGAADECFLQNISSSNANALFVSQSELTRTFGKIAQSMGNSTGAKGRDKDTLNTDTWEESI